MMMFSTTVWCILSLFLLPSTFVQARDVVSFDFGWKFRTGLSEWASPDARPPLHPYPCLHPPEANYTYNTSDWEDVALPHDGLIASQPSVKACPDGCSGQSFLPRPVLWYRKEFSLPSDWKDSSIWLEFEGSFRNTTIWINGNYVLHHKCGYTPFYVRLDDIFSTTHKSVIAVFVDPNNGDAGGRDHGSGWWYEGGGLYRHVWLVRAYPIHVAHDGFFSYSSDIVFDNNMRATLHTRVDIVNDDTTSPQDVCVSFHLKDPEGVPIMSTPSQQVLISEHTTTVTDSMNVTSPKLWNARTPMLYEVSATIDNCNGRLLDSVSVPHGFRDLKFDANRGFFLNRQPFKVRGFCDHDSFAVVGMAVPDRINLFRAQASRAIGGNGRRMSHNPPAPSLLDIYDRLGMVVIDENRLFADNPAYVENMKTLVRRDRNHPSVIIWSFCNEGDCEGEHEKGGPAFQAVCQQHDGTRPTLANMFTYNDLLSNTIDVQGFSHQSRQQLDACHAALPDKPILMSECCSCNTMRSEDVGCETEGDNPHNLCIQQSFNGRCLEHLVNASDGVDYAVGTMVWTLFDYYGEPPVGPQEVSSTYGQFDLCGFPKSSAFWFRSQWLLSISDDRMDKPFPTNNKVKAYIVESWESPDSWNETKGNTTRVIHAYSNAPFLELFVNHQSQGTKSLGPAVKGLAPSYAEWTAVPWEKGKITAVARNADGKELARTNRFTNTRAVKLVLSLDAPSEATGTGSALLLDGQEAALVRASIVDSAGRLMHFADNNVTFSIISGPGRVQGTANGDPHCHLPNNVSWHPAYHGLVRAVIRVTSVAGRSVNERRLLRKIDQHGPMSSTQRLLTSSDESDIVVEASSPGFGSVRISIHTTTDESAVASKTAEVGAPVEFFQETHVPLGDNSDATQLIS